MEPDEIRLDELHVQAQGNPRASHSDHISREGPNWRDFLSLLSPGDLIRCHIKKYSYEWPSGTSGTKGPDGELFLEVMKIEDKDIIFTDITTNHFIAEGANHTSDEVSEISCKPIEILFDGGNLNRRSQSNSSDNIMSIRWSHNFRSSVFVNYINRIRVMSTGTRGKCGNI